MQKDSGEVGLKTTPDDDKAARTRALATLAWISDTITVSLQNADFRRTVESVEAGDISSSKSLCLAVWPFIRGLPDNITAVKNKLDAHTDGADAGQNLLSQLADDERHYQNLYLKQFILAGMTQAEVEEMVALPDDQCASQAVLTFAQRMHFYCQQGTTAQGVLAVVTAELMATQFARVAFDAFQKYFSERESEYGRETVEQGLAWLALHAKTNTRHAIAMRKMLIAVEDDEIRANKRPACVRDLIDCLTAIWKQPA